MEVVIVVFVLLINCLLINEAFAAQCLPGQYSTGGGDDIHSCLDCSPGTYSNPTRTACILCDSGGYCPSRSATDGGYTPCPPLRYNKDKGKYTVLDCKPCGRGKYPNGPRTECEEQCRLGNFLEVTGSVYKCTACTLGTYSNAERSECILCSEVCRLEYSNSLFGSKKSNIFLI